MKFLLILFVFPQFAIAQQNDTLRFGKTIFVGQITDGELNGYGYEYYKGDLRYEGEFLNTEWHGKGKAFFKTYIEEGQWENGVLINGKLYSSLNDRVYEGNWKDRELINGVIRYDYGFQIEASTRNLDPHGPGIMTFSDKTKVETTFNKGKPVGNGVVKYPNGETIEGKWKRTKSNEINLFVKVDGLEEKAKLTNGKILRLVKE